MIITSVFKNNGRVMGLNKADVVFSLCRFKPDY
jgi:hypothetical protein